ncbi:MAG TPA: hypothetical protein VFH95_00285 [Candidatus Kapabacteria bacterium]|nr:hypothetical protein [Candidatus Kapabacteria bacterium]
MSAIWLGAAIGFFSAGPCAAQDYHWRRAYFPHNNSDPWSAVAFNPLSHGRVIFAGPLFVGGIFRSDDGGNTWVEHATLLDTNALSRINDVHQVFCLPSDTNIVFAITSNSLYRSTDGGITWDDRYNHDTLGGGLGLGFGGIDAECMAYSAKENAIYYGEPPDGGLFRSIDSGASWTQLDTTSDSIRFFSMDVSQDVPPSIIQSTDFDGSFAFSSDEGSSWAVTFRPDAYFESPKIVFSWQAVNSTTGKHSIAIAQQWKRVESSNDSSFLSTTDGGASWQILNGPAFAWGLDIDQRTSMLSKPRDPAYPRPLHFFTGLFDARQDTGNGMVQETTDGGLSWHSINFPQGVPGDTLNPIVQEVWVIKYDTTSGRIAVATDSGIYIADPSSGVAEAPPPTPPIQLTQDADFVTLSSQMPIASIRVFDLAGRQIIESDPMRNIFRISIAQYPPGVYAIEVFVEGQPPFRKIVEW